MPMPATTSMFDYAIVRVVPRIERGECFNAGVILFCRPRRFLGARIYLDTARLHALAPHLNPAIIQSHLDRITRICDGDSTAGPIGQLPLSERFHWLTAPRSTIIQTSPIHNGLCSDLSATLDHLLQSLVLPFDLT